MDNKNDGYETFRAEDLVTYHAPEEKHEAERSSKLSRNRNVISTVMMSLVLLVSAASLVVGIINYNRFNDIQLNAQFYIQNGDETVNPQMNEVLSGYVLYEPETTTVPHIEIVTETTTVADENNVTTAAVTTTVTDAVTTSAAPTTARQTAVTQKSSPQTGIININIATVEELTALDGVGEKKAQAIVEYRNENGYFTTVEELTNVSGIGEKTLEKNRNKITVG